MPTSAAAAPPSSSTVAATNGAFTASRARNTPREAGGIVTGTLLGSPWFGVKGAVPGRSSAPLLTAATDMSPLPPFAAVPPAQYHVDERARAGGPTDMLPAVARTALGRPKL